MYVYELPSGPTIELKEMTGAEEELLTNQRLIRNGHAINQVLRNCTVRLDENEAISVNDILDLLSGDRLFALVKLRQISLGDEVELELNCHSSSCRTTNHVTVNLEELHVTPYTENREFEFELPGSKKLVSFGYLDGHKEKRLAALKETSISSAMMIRLIDIDGKPPSKKLLSEMSMRDRTALRQEMVRVDAGINTTVEVDCDGCGGKIRTKLEAEADFLFPNLRL